MHSAAYVLIHIPARSHTGKLREWFPGTISNGTNGYLNFSLVCGGGPGETLKLLYGSERDSRTGRFCCQGVEDHPSASHAPSVPPPLSHLDVPQIPFVTILCS